MVEIRMLIIASCYLGLRNVIGGLGDIMGKQHPCLEDIFLFLDSF